MELRDYLMFRNVSKTLNFDQNTGTVNLRTVPLSIEEMKEELTVGTSLQNLTSATEKTSFLCVEEMDRVGGGRGELPQWVGSNHYFIGYNFM